MPISISCTCGKSYQIKEEFAGRKVRCAKCQNVLAVPKPVYELDPEDEILEVVPVDQPGQGASRPQSSSHIQTPRPKAGSPITPQSSAPPPLPRQPVELEEYDGVPRKRRRRKKRKRSRSRPGIAFEEGWFGSVDSGVAGGFLMIVIAVVWFVVGLGFGYIFFFPPVLLVIGVIAVMRGVLSGN